MFFFVAYGSPFYKEVGMRSLFLSLVLGGCSLGSLFAATDTLTVPVTVMCNTRSISGLTVLVFDQENTSVSTIINPTNASGVFSFVYEIGVNSPPFSMEFIAPDGSTCGQYPITINDSFQGTVFLPYRPTSLPCSCSKLGFD
jgi:hypothetical protein